MGGSAWLYFTRQDCTYRHIYSYIGLVVVSLSLFFSALSLPACSSTGEESCVYKKLRAYDPHEGQGPLHGWFTRFDVTTSFTIISRQSCLQERDIRQIRMGKRENDQGQQEQQQDDEDGAAAAAAKMVGGRNVFRACCVLCMCLGDCSLCKPEAKNQVCGRTL